ncbi:MAG TPA: hypothetical protein PLT87_02980 [Spirochaetales bacterium]|nr:hypothetical protein [Spirochaetales bacterium]
MTHSQREIIFSEIDKALSDAPRNGTVTFTLYFTDGDVTRMECNKVKEIKFMHTCSGPGPGFGAGAVSGPGPGFGAGAVSGLGPDPVSG